MRESWYKRLLTEEFIMEKIGTVGGKGERGEKDKEREEEREKDKRKIRGEQTVGKRES
jgi:hypothetical protein